MFLEFFTQITYKMTNPTRVTPQKGSKNLYLTLFMSMQIYTHNHRRQSVYTIKIILLG